MTQRLDIVNAIIKSGANINTIDSLGVTSLEYSQSNLNGII